MKKDKIKLYIYEKIDNELYFDVYEGRYGESDGSCIYYGLQEENYYGFQNTISTCYIGKVLDNDKVILIGRDDKKASDIFADYYSQQIEKLQNEIVKLQKNQKTDKVLWFRDGIGCLEEKEFDL